MTAAGTIDYDALAQRALLQVLRGVLRQAEQYGLPGEHHFYISFDTQAAGVVLSERLKSKYPKEMTIVLQHRFWDLAVREDDFEVKLTFDGIPERLVIPFDSIRVFFDPSVRYAIQFNSTDQSVPADEEAGPEGTGIGTSEAAPDQDKTRAGHGSQLLPLPPRAVPKVPAPLRSVKTETTESEDEAGRDSPTEDAPSLHDERDDRSEKPSDDADKPRDEDEDEAGSSDNRSSAPGVVVSLDAFRKK